MNKKELVAAHRTLRIQYDAVCEQLAHVRRVRDEQAEIINAIEKALPNLEIVIEEEVEEDVDE